MNQELKATVVNMKSWHQDIEEPIVIGGGDANGRSLRIIFTQEAAAQMTPNTKVYLSWKHQEQKIKGYNVFTQIIEDEDWPPTWEIHYPKSMMQKGHVLACIQLVDDVSIATSTNFIICILEDPNPGDDYLASSDYSDFQKIIIILNNIVEETEAKIENWEEQFAEMQEEFSEIKNDFSIMQEEIQNEFDEMWEKINNNLSEFQIEFQEIKNITNNANEKSNESLAISEEARTIAEQALRKAEEALSTSDGTRIEEVRSELIDYINDQFTVLEV